MIKNDNEILRAGIITPTIGYLCRSNESNPHQRAISWGISSFGYDVRLAPELKAFRLPSLHETAPLTLRTSTPASSSTLTCTLTPKRASISLWLPTPTL